MPELPEVETIRRDLAALLPGKTLARAEVSDRRVLEGYGPGAAARRCLAVDAFSAALAGRAVRAVHRRGKYLVIDLGEGPALMAHLRMTGRLVWEPPRDGARARLFFRGESHALHFFDTRRFGEMWLAGDWRRDPSIVRLGPEPLETGWDEDAWGRSLRRSSSRLHAALLDQRRLAGVGNIYATEALFRAGTRPTRRACSVRARDIPGLLSHIRDVLREGLAHRGVSFRDYRDVRGQRGQARTRLRVYGRAAAPCPSCATTLRGIKVGGRGTVYCPRCQR